MIECKNFLFDLKIHGIKELRMNTCIHFMWQNQFAHGPIQHEVLSFVSQNSAKKHRGLHAAFHFLVKSDDLQPPNLQVTVSVLRVSCARR